MALTADEARAIAEAIAEHYRPRTERVTVPGKLVKKLVKKKVIRTRPVEVEEELDKGPHPALWGVLGGGWGLAVILLASGVNFLVAGLFAVGVTVAFFVARGSWRRVEREKVTREEEYEDTVEEEVVEKLPDTYEERPVPPKTRVRTIGRMRLTFQAVPFRDGAVLTDGYGLTDPLEFSYPELRDPDHTRETIDALEELAKRVPWMLSGERQQVPLSVPTPFSNQAPLVGYERQVREHYTTLAALVEDLRTANWSLPVFHSTHEILRHVRPTPRPGPASAARDEVVSTLELLQSPRTEGLDGRLRQLVELWRAAHPPIHGARSHALRLKIRDTCDLWHAVPHFSSLNFYCIVCNSERAEELRHRDYAVNVAAPPRVDLYDPSTRMVLDPDLRQWRCPQCERTTRLPALQTHKLLDELFLPVYDLLLEENKNARLERYTVTRTGEFEYQKEMATELREVERRNRNAVDALEEEIRRFRAEITGDERAIASLEEIRKAHKIRQSEALQRITEQVRKILAVITSDQKQASKNLNEAFERERADLDARFKGLGQAKRLEDEKRDAPYRAAAERAEEAGRASRPAADRPPEVATVEAGLGVKAEPGPDPLGERARESIGQMVARRTQGAPESNGRGQREGQR